MNTCHSQNIRISRCLAVAWQQIHSFLFSCSVSILVGFFMAVTARNASTEQARFLVVPNRLGDHAILLSCKSVCWFSGWVFPLTHQALVIFSRWISIKKRSFIMHQSRHESSEHNLLASTRRDLRTAQYSMSIFCQISISYPRWECLFWTPLFSGF